MGLIARSVTSKRFPFSQLSKNVKKMEQIKMVAMKYGVEDQLHLHRNRRDWSVLGAHEEMLQHISKSFYLLSIIIDLFSRRYHRSQISEAEQVQVGGRPFPSRCCLLQAIPGLTIFEAGNLQGPARNDYPMGQLSS
jgi:hypothetical protein